MSQASLIQTTGKVLAAVAYDPETSQSVSFSAFGVGIEPMSAFDTTNLRLTFAAPSTGRVRVKIGVAADGSNLEHVGLFLGVLDGSTVKLRTPAQFIGGFDNVGMVWINAVVSGLTPGQSYTWDAAFGSERDVSNTWVRWGGGNDNTSARNGFGAFIYEISEA